MKNKRLCKAEQQSPDIISRLPQPILETILCHLFIKEAARTSILSREWRYKWTQIPKLKFHLPLDFMRIADLEQAQGKNINIDAKCRPFYYLHQFLLQHQGPIHELNLFMEQSLVDQDSSGFDRVLLHLSKNHPLRRLKLEGVLPDRSRNYLPISVFSLLHLTHLDLAYFNIEAQPIFNGFGHLRSLSLYNVGISTKTLLHLLSNCPSLKRLTLNIIDKSHRGGKDCSVIELFKCLPMIEHLSTYGVVLKWLILDPVPQELPTLLFHLKSFCSIGIHFVNDRGLAFLLILIKCSPNLEKIELQTPLNRTCNEEFSVAWEEYSDVWLEHLTELKIKCFRDFNLKPEMEFVKFILARSPKLKKVSIIGTFSNKQGSKLLETLLQGHRASPAVITVASTICRALFL